MEHALRNVNLKDAVVKVVTPFCLCAKRRKEWFPTHTLTDDADLFLFFFLSGMAAYCYALELFLKYKDKELKVLCRHPAWLPLVSIPRYNHFHVIFLNSGSNTLTKLN